MALSDNELPRNTDTGSGDIDDDYCHEKTTIPTILHLSFIKCDNCEKNFCIFTNCNHPIRTDDVCEFSECKICKYHLCICHSLQQHHFL